MRSYGLPSWRILPCIPESKVLSVLIEAHDDSGHWAKAGTLARLRTCYWPGQSQDVKRYIAGCLNVLDMVLLLGLNPYTP